ncbi:MAG TPA: DAHL domain-containing protein, partial [Pyrinomonadaceae bacterium]|nr:DAHL domain-containing protein [Pyrinomonadaceae bacterium]
MKIGIRQVLIGVGLIILVTTLFVKTNRIDSGAHNGFRQDVRRLRELDATLEKDILESRYGLLTTYDVIIGDLIEIEHQQEELNRTSSNIEVNDRQELTRLLGESAELQEQKRTLIERFKSRNAILNNSISYFPVATADLIKKLPQDPAGRREVDALNDLLRDTLTCYLLANSGLEHQITGQISQLREAQKTRLPGDVQTGLDITLSHSATILKLKPEVDGLVKQIFSIPTESKLEEVLAINEAYYDEAMRHARIYRILLYTFSDLMLGYVAFTFFKLRKATSALHLINENLEHRVQVRTEELQESRDYLDSIINAVGDPIFVKDRAHKWTMLNEAMCKFMGHDRDDLLGKSDYDFFPSQEADPFWEKDELVFTSGGKNINEETFTDSQGEKHYVLTRKTLHTDKKGEQYIVAVITDITDLKQAEEDLRENIRTKEESIALLDTILSTAPIGFIFYNCDLEYERVNPTLAAINGISVEDHIGRRTRDVVPEFGDALESLMKGVLESGEPVVNLELTGETKADPGKQHYWLLNFYPVNTQAGETLGIGVLIQDITEQKLLEDKLQRGQKLESIGQLAAGIAHEINTPTQYVGDNVRFLQDSFLDVNTVLEKNAEMMQLCRSQQLFPEFLAEM